MMPLAASSAAGFESVIQTSWPVSARTWAMPLPIWPAPTTPTRSIAMAGPLFMPLCSMGEGAGGRKMRGIRVELQS
jgi:hypothetical protein